MKYLIPFSLLVNRKNLLKLVLFGFLAFAASSCYAPLSSSKLPKTARKKLNTYNHRKMNAAKYGVQDKSVDCPSSSRRREKY
jgi:hypothetical protein